MSRNEQALVLGCEGSSMIGVLSGAGLPAGRGVLIVVGGPQYRVGSHRQFILLARHLADRGVPTLRFDYRGMGDSRHGSLRGFDADLFGVAPREAARRGVHAGGRGDALAAEREASE